MRRDGEQGPTPSGSEVGDAARSALSRLDRGGNMDKARAVAVWREVAGAEVAAHAMGFALRGSELLVYVDSPVWATELSALSERYRSEINATLGKELVGSMRFTLSKKVSEERVWDDAERRSVDDAESRRVTPVPVTDQERSQIEAMAAGIHDETLRQAAIRAAISGLEWRKGRSADNSPQNALQSADKHEKDV
jgi:hypothetical protein